MNIRPVTPDDRPGSPRRSARRSDPSRLVSNERLTKTRPCSTASSSRTTAVRSAARSGTRVDGDAELVGLVTTYRGAGAGTALLDAVVERGRQDGWKRLWLITTNDNTDAIRLYQRAGWDWVAFRARCDRTLRGR